MWGCRCASDLSAVAGESRERRFSTIRIDGMHSWIDSIGPIESMDQVDLSEKESDHICQFIWQPKSGGNVVILKENWK